MGSTLIVDSIQGATAANSVDLSSVTNLKMPAGAVIQVIQTTGTTQTQVTTTGTWTDVVPTATITPKFSTSKILVSHSAGGFGQSSTAGNSFGFRLLRASTTIASRARQAYQSVNNYYEPVFWQMEFLDSPSTTAAITYKFQIYLEKAGNLRHSSEDADISPSTSIAMTTLMEIAQ